MKMKQRICLYGLKINDFNSALSGRALETYSSFVLRAVNYGVGSRQSHDYCCTNAGPES